LPNRKPKAFHPLLLFSPHSKGNPVFKLIDTARQAMLHARISAVFGKVALLAAAAMLSFVAGCSKPVEEAEEVRPVRAMVLTADNVDVVAEYPGEVRPRVESRLGFRVGGKIAARKVDVGSAVKRGQVLMQLDAQDLQLLQAQSNANLKAAESNLALAKAEFGRYQDLRQKNFVSQAVLDAKETAFRAAQATHEQAAAAYRNQSNQTGYSTLVSDVDGVVTGIDAEVGQVVAAGTPVVRVAQPGEKEIVISIPEDKVDRLRQVQDVRVRIWTSPDKLIAGKLRELSPMADPATRTYTAKVAMSNPPAEVRLGMTAVVSFAARMPNAMIKLPLTALFQDKSQTMVWVVENGTVKPMPVQVGAPSGNEVLIAGGVSTGQTVVTAGVNLLKPGQKVKILGDDAIAKDGGAIASNAEESAAGAVK
jgi:RND family efflux transporter MFP subunit